MLAGWVHPPYRGRLWLKRALAAEPGYSFDEVTSLSEAARRPLASYAALVLYYHHRDAVLAAHELGALRSFVDDGGGILALHSATASYKPTAAYFEILGGRFIGHGPIGSIAIEPADAADTLFGGIPPFTVLDELYRHQLQGDIRVRFHGAQDGERLPVVWTREQKGGRVCYLSPGHRAASIRHPAVQEIARRGLRWVSRR